MAAIEMPEEEQRRRMRALRRRVRDHDVADWSRSFLGDLSSITR
jgi:trehalose 6-phosphate synthase